MACAWDPNLSLGVPVIDEQHQQLFQRIDGLLTAMHEHRGKDETVRLMGFLGEYVVDHFGAEAHLMRVRAYPQAAAHLAEHTLFTRSMRALAADLEASGPSLPLALKVNTRLGDWLRGHIRQTDRRLADFLRQEARSEP